MQKLFSSSVVGGKCLCRERMLKNERILFLDLISRRPRRQRLFHCVFKLETKPLPRVPSTRGPCHTIYRKRKKRCRFRVFKPESLARSAVRTRGARAAGFLADTTMRVAVFPPFLSSFSSPSPSSFPLPKPETSAASSRVPPGARCPLCRRRTLRARPRPRASGRRLARVPGGRGGGG